MDIIDAILIFAGGYFIGKAHAYYSMVSALKRAAAEAGIDLLSEIKASTDNESVEIVEKVHLLRIEKHDETLYLYDRVSDDFLCQASTLTDLAKNAKEFKNILLASVIYGEKVFVFMNGTSEEFEVE